MKNIQVKYITFLNGRKETERNMTKGNIKCYPFSNILAGTYSISLRQIMVLLYFALNLTVIFLVVMIEN